MLRNKQWLWLWLHWMLGPCNARFGTLLREFGYVESVYEKRETAQMAALLTPAEYKRARERTADSFQEQANYCAQKGIHLVHYSDDSYPERLRATRFAPVMLFVTGEVGALSCPLAVAGVGARFSTKYGREAVRHICAPLARAGVALISGMAHGIDAEVHRVALEEGGVTVAVLGTPIDETYPVQHMSLRRAIEQGGGAVVSEYAPGTSVHKGMFAQRNRIVSGLARAVVIFEAAKKSGTMITATWALDDGRDVFAVPGSILSAHSEGTNYLLKNGAGVATSAMDVIESWNLRGEQFEQTTFDLPKEDLRLTAEEKKIYDVLSREEMTVDAIVDKTGLAPHQVLAQLTNLEIAGIIEPLAGSRYSLR